MRVIKVHTGDTDVNFHYISINDIIYSSLGEAKPKALPVFHAITGCDTVSAFKGKARILLGMPGKLIWVSLYTFRLSCTNF